MTSLNVRMRVRLACRRGTRWFYEGALCVGRYVYDGDRDGWFMQRLTLKLSCSDCKVGVALPSRQLSSSSAITGGDFGSVVDHDLGSCPQTPQWIC